ncbi:MAG: LysR family transcriptional regulator [Lachnospiraceae bacterium]
MEIRQLVTFIKVAQLQSFSKAAENLGYSQSAVTVQIRLLEEDLNTKLFDRIGKHITVTAQGQEFLTYAYSILNEINKAKLSLNDDTELNKPLHIGTIESLCFSKLPPILSYFRENYPKVAIRITTASPEELIEMMEHNQLDLIYILDEPKYNNNWNKVMEVRENIVFVASSTSEPADIHRLTLGKLLEYPFFLTEKNANYRHALDHYLASKKMIMSPFLEISNTEFIIKMLTESNGISFLPYFTVRKSVEEGKLTLLEVDSFHVSMYRQIFYHKDKWMTREMAEFIRLAEEIR